MNNAPENSVSADPTVSGEADASANLARKVIELETYVMHLQHDTESLNQALLDLQRKFDVLSKVLRMHDERLHRLLGEGEEFDVNLDRPPHY